MKILRFRNHFLQRKQKKIARFMYEKEINVCLSLKRLKIVIPKFGCNNENLIDNNKFWKTVKLLLSVSIQGEEISGIKKKKKSD